MINTPCKSILYDIIIDPFGNIIECWWRKNKLYNILDNLSIKNIKINMWDDCKKCWFSHVRKWDYDDWYNPLKKI